MSHARKLVLVLPVLVFILACQAVTKPIQQVEETTGTAAALATQAGEFVTQAGELVTQASGLTTAIAPIETLMPNGSAIPNNIFDPQSPPVSEWQGIPVMPQASAGEASTNMYVYRIAAQTQEVKEFYAKELSALGWTESFSMPVEGTAIYAYTKGQQVLSITVMHGQNPDELLVMLNLQ